MCDAIGHPVRRLVRTRIATLRDTGLAPGNWRELTGTEVRRVGHRGRTFVVADKSSSPVNG